MSLDVDDAAARCLIETSKRFELVSVSFPVVGVVSVWSRQGKSVGFVNVHKSVAGDDVEIGNNGDTTAIPPFDARLDVHLVPQMLWPASDVVSRYIIAHGDVFRGTTDQT